MSDLCVFTLTLINYSAFLMNTLKNCFYGFLLDVLIMKNKMITGRMLSQLLSNLHTCCSERSSVMTLNFLSATSASSGLGASDKMKQSGVPVCEFDPLRLRRVISVLWESVSSARRLSLALSISLNQPRRDKVVSLWQTAKWRKSQRSSLKIRRLCFPVLNTSEKTTRSRNNPGEVMARDRDHWLFWRDRKRSRSFHLYWPDRRFRVRDFSRSTGNVKANIPKLKNKSKSYIWYHFTEGWCVEGYKTPK